MTMTRRLLRGALLALVAALALASSNGTRDRAPGETGPRGWSPVRLAAAQEPQGLDRFFKRQEGQGDIVKPRAKDDGPKPKDTWNRPIGGYVETEGGMNPAIFMASVAAGVLVLNALGAWFPKAFNLSLVRGLTSIAIIVIVWEASSYLGLVTSILLPPPTAVIGKLAAQWQRGYVQIHVFYSVRRLLNAFLLAICTGIPIGFLIANFRRFSDYLDPLFNLIRVVPPPAWLPFAILWLGIGDPPSVYIIWLGAFFPILLNTIAGVKATQKIHIESILNLGGSRLDVFRRVMLPSAFPTIATGVRVGFGIGWICLVTAELVAVDAGLGWMIDDARTLLDTPAVLGGMVLICALGITFDILLRRAEAAIVRW
jgi:ABC-type nitrate/sulfonate/bicarbonate transport system permease component